MNMLNEVTFNIITSNFAEKNEWILYLQGKYNSLKRPLQNGTSVL